MTSYFNLFTGNPVQPSQVSYQSISLTADLVLNWTTSGFETANIVTLLIDVTSNNAAWTITLPPANQVSIGMAIIFNNQGSHAVPILDATGGAITTVPVGGVDTPSAIYIYLSNNTTVAGVWHNLTFGAGTSSADAATLAGLGLVALSNTLNTNIPVNTLGMDILNYDVTENDNASLLIWRAGAGTITLPDPADLPQPNGGFYISVHNASTVGGLVEIVPQSTNKIDGATSPFQINPGQSTFFILSGDNENWWTVGYGQETFFGVGVLVVDVTDQTSITINDIQAQNLLQYYVGTLSSDVSIFLPNVAAQYYIFNQTTGGFNLFITIVSNMGSPINIGQEQNLIFASDGTTLYTIPTAPPGSLFPDGSQAEPSISFTDETDLGFYRIGTGVMGVASQNSTPIRFKTSGITLLNGSDASPSYAFTNGDSGTSGMFWYQVGTVSFTGSGNHILDMINNVGAGNEVDIYGTTTGSSALYLYNQNNTFSVGFSIGTLAADSLYTLPTAYPGTSGMALISSTTGTMSWSTSSFVAGGILVPDGSSGSPSISFTNHPTSGFYFNTIIPAISVYVGGSFASSIGNASINANGFSSVNGGSVGATIYTFGNTFTTGIYQSSANNIDFSCSSTNILNLSTSGVKIAANKSLSFLNPAGTFNTFLQSGVTLANTTYTLPTAYPGTSGMALISSTTGTMNWSVSSFDANGIKVPNGSLSTPSLSFTSSPNSGFSYDSGTPSIDISIGGSFKASIDSTGFNITNGNLFMLSGNSVVFEAADASTLSFSLPSGAATNYTIQWPTNTPTTGDTLRATVSGSTITLAWGV